MISYEVEVFRLIEFFRSRNIEINNVVITLYTGQKKVEEFMDYKIDGKPLKRKARHPVGLCATLAEAALALERQREPLTPKQKAQAKRAVKRFWETPLRKGKRRYYDNCLYFFCLLMLGGQYKKYM